MIAEFSDDSSSESSKEENSPKEKIPPVIRRQKKSNLGSRIISNPKLIKSLAEEEELERLNKRLSYTGNVNSKRTSTYIYCEPERTDKRDIDSRQSWRKYLGIILALLASAVLSASSLLVKLIPDYHPYSVVVWTFQGIFLPSIPVLVYHRFIKKKNLITNVGANVNFQNFKLSLFLTLRGLLGSGGVVLRIYSLQYMSMGDSTVIAFSSPVFVIVVAWLLLDEKCGFVPILAALVTLVGVGLIANPSLITGEQEFDSDQLIGASMSFGCMLLGVFGVIVLRYIRHVHFALVTLVYGLLGTVTGLILALTSSEGFEFPQGALHWVYAFGIAFLTFVGQSLLTIAFKFEQAGPIALVRTTEIIFAFLLQFIFLGVVPHWISSIGAIVVVAGVITITVRKWVESLPESHNSKKTCWLILK